mmetsp:Transcript_30233/g.41845  ORF Transcript_30233/g.41845 Transcript_30233/m.41845 type:complete len:619 (+) Transcript_30233:130-1986(+)|eukprot:CAMPEP_0196582478 /NCGR_PEP_ID=MMETSP1081-20130531/39037_1 /TAXON_ID=36882 /ORGANISM="Pyramimonas amylifera, Strain CCMP720" /LENGTH=618 /DNA_ID=CAMNT_0041903041 /DNA_START=112 /DNA_END=1968 /DNA_ORIENTATION=-
MFGESELEDVTGNDPLSANNPNSQFKETLPTDWDQSASSDALDDRSNKANTHVGIEGDEGEMVDITSHESLTSYNEMIAPPSYSDTVFPSSLPSALPSPQGVQPSDSPLHNLQDPTHPRQGQEDHEEEEEVALERLKGSQARRGGVLKGLLEVTVSDPVKRDDASSKFAVVGKKYVEYLVTTKTSLPGFAGTQFSTRRRFRDFVSLAEVLAASHRGYVIPARPEKSLMEGQMSAERAFMEDRRAQLEKYLRALAAHPVLRHSAELRSFLELQTDFSTSHVLGDHEGSIVQSAARLPKQIFGYETANNNPAEASQPASAGRDFLRVFKEMRQAVSQSPVVASLSDAVGVQTKPQGTLEDHHHLTHKVGSSVVELDRQLQEASRRAEQLALKKQAAGDVLGELGMSLIKLANFQEAEGGRLGQYTEEGSILCSAGQHISQIGRVAVRLARLSRSASSQVVAHLEPLHDYLALNNSVRKALADRTNALLTAQTLESELKAKKERMTKLETHKAKVFGGEKNHQRRVEDLRKEIEACENSHRCAVQEYGRIKSRNLSEWDRVCAQRQADFSHMLAGLARVEAALAVRSAAIWLQVAKDLGGEGEVEEISVSRGVKGQSSISA